MRLVFQGAGRCISAVSRARSRNRLRTRPRTHPRFLFELALEIVSPLELCSNLLPLLPRKSALRRKARICRCSPWLVRKVEPSTRFARNGICLWHSIAFRRSPKGFVLSPQKSPWGCPPKKSPWGCPSPKSPWEFPRFFPPGRWVAAKCVTAKFLLLLGSLGWPPPNLALGKRYMIMYGPRLPRGV